MIIVPVGRGCIPADAVCSVAAVSGSRCCQQACVHRSAPLAQHSTAAKSNRSLQDDMRCAEDYVRFCCRWVLDHCQTDLAFIAKMYDAGCIARLEQVGGCQSSNRVAVAVVCGLCRGHGQNVWRRLRRAPGAGEFSLSVALAQGAQAQTHHQASSRQQAPVEPAAPGTHCAAACHLPRQVAASPFARCSYTEAIEKLEAAVAGGRKFENAVSCAGHRCLLPLTADRVVPSASLDADLSFFMCLRTTKHERYLLSASHSQPCTHIVKRCPGASTWPPSTSATWRRSCSRGPSLCTTTPRCDPASTAAPRALHCRAGPAFVRCPIGVCPQVTSLILNRANTCRRSRRST